MKKTFKHIVSTGALLGCCLCLFSTAASADLLTDVKQKKEMNIGTEAQFAPFEFIKDGKIVGYSADLLSLIMADLPGVQANRP